MRLRLAGNAVRFALVGAATLPLLVSCAFGGSPSAEPELAYSIIPWDGIDRVAATYSPLTLADPAAVVLLLHGGFSSASDMWQTELAQSWKALSDRYGFLLVLPEGAPDAGDPSSHHWNDCRVDAGNLDSLSSEDDVGFIRRALDVISARVSVDPGRVYVTGASNGGMMTYRLAMQLGNRFAAVAAIVANLSDPSECPAEANPLPILIMNGMADPVMPYEGGCVAGPTCQRERVLSTAATVAFWVRINGASTTPVVTDLPDTVPSDGSTIRVFRFDGGASRNDVVLYRVEGGGHNAPGPGPLPAENKNRDIDAATEIWDFFQAHVRTPR